jgi:hypothetical protein
VKSAKWIETRVAVNPDIPSWVRREDEQRRAMEICEELKTQIKRHCDDVGWIVIEEVTEPVCSFCGGKWTEDSDTYNDGCCEDDEQNNPEKSEVKS